MPFLTVKYGHLSSKLNDRLRKSDGALKTTLERLSSGIRVNHAKDDAASLAINTRLNARLRGAQVAVRNIADSVSLLQTVDGALEQKKTTLLRARELAAQAVNDHKTQRDIDDITQEFTELMEHINMISAQTQFNGMHILDPESQDQLTFQISESAGEELSLGSLQVNTECLGRQARYTSQRRGCFVSATTAGDMKINGVDIRGTQVSDDQLSYCYAHGSMIAKAAAINSASEHTGVRAIVGPTEIRGFEPIQGMTLDTQHYLKINGHIFSGITFEDRDANGILVDHINAGFNQTQVKASMTEDGHLTFIAEDGRNITVEYGSEVVRDALRVIDYCGDLTNLSGTVGTVTTELDGDIDTVVFSGTSGFSGHFDITPAAQEFINQGPATQVINADRGAYPDSPRDHVDIVLEVVEPGQFGVATFRVKEESISDHTADALSENYRFNSAGHFTSTGNKVFQDSSSFYNEASNRRYTLNVTKAGNPADPSNLPEFTYSIFNTDTNTLEFTDTTPRQAQSGQSETLLHNVIVDFSDQTFFSSQNVNISSGDSMRESVNTTQGFNNNPTFNSWVGPSSTRYDIAVKTSGHYTTNAPLGGSHTSAATLEVTATDISSNTSLGVPVTINLPSGVGNTGPNFSAHGLNFRLDPDPSNVGIGINGGTSTYSFATQASQHNTVYTGPENRSYKVTFLNSGRISNISGLNAQIEVSNSGGLLESYSTTIFAGDNRLGRSTFDEGVVLNLDPSATTESLSRTQGDYTEVSLGGPYTGTTDDTITFKITTGGEVGSGTPQFEYFYASNPANLITGTVGTAPISLGNGVNLTFNTDANGKLLDPNDEWSISLGADIIQAGATVDVQPNTRNLLAGHTWTLITDPPEWSFGDTYELTLSHNFSPTEHTLTNTINLSNVGAFNINGAGGHSFATGDEIRVHTRGFTGSATAGGAYGDSLYPTDYIVVITEAGEIGTAKYSWARADHRQDIANGVVGHGTGTTSASMEELDSGLGVEIAWNQSTSTTTPSYLAVGDTFRIPVGQKLEYTFGGQLTLQSENNIEIEYTDLTIDNQFGRLLYTGPEDEADKPGENNHSIQGTLGTNTARSLNDLTLSDRFKAEEAVDTIDLALNQIGEIRTVIGSLMNVLESRSRSHEQGIIDLKNTSSRLIDADIAAETAALTKAQIIRSMSPFLAQTSQLHARQALELLQ